MCECVCVWYGCVLGIRVCVCVRVRPFVGLGGGFVLLINKHESPETRTLLCVRVSVLAPFSRG